MEWVQLLSLLIGIIGGLIAASRAIIELRENRIQRMRELRWRQAKVGKEALDELFTHPSSEKAVFMLDWASGKREYELEKGQRVTISYPEILSAIQKDASSDLSPKEVFIRDCFDYLFYFLDRIEHYIAIGLITLDDVAIPLKPYVRQILAHREFNEAFFKRYSSSMERLFRRFQSPDDREANCLLPAVDSLHAR